MADSQKKLHCTLLKEAAFIHSGFSNWKDATTRFRNHEKSMQLKSVHGENYSNELAAVIEVYKDDLDSTRLEIQLDTLRSSLT